MKNHSLSSCLISSVTTLCLFGNAQAGSPLWTFTSLTPTTVSVPSNGTTIVRYSVTNKSHTQHTLSMKLIAGITQDTSNGYCSNPFSLGYKQSCTLSLTITGSALKGTIIGGPKVCEGSSTNQCYLPNPADSLNVSLENVPANEYIYITNGGDNTITQCQINSYNGLLENCSQTNQNTFNSPYGVAVNDSYAYVANVTTSSVDKCALDPSTDALITSSCVSTGSGFSSASSIALNNGYAFVENPSPTANNISTCTVGLPSGNLTNCHTSGTGFNYPQGGMAFSSNHIYVTNFDITVSKCDVDPSTGTLSNCNYTGGNVFNTPAGIGIYNGYAYVANYGSNNVLFCRVSLNSGDLSDCSSTGSFVGGATFNAPNGVGVHNGFIYIENSGNSTVLRCIPDPETGELTLCTATGNSFNVPQGQIGFY